MRLDLLAVSVGKPAPHGTWQGERVLSGIRKTPLATPHVFVGETNIDGDGQADLTVHGGRDKAVYAYPADNWPWWRNEAAFDPRPASFGENLTLQGATENDVRIGDRFTWGPDVALEVSQPRAPCFKFAMLTLRQDLGTRMTVSARTGWYFRVLRTGIAPAQGSLARTHTDELAPTIRDAFAAAYHPRVGRDLIDRVLSAPALSQAWREAVSMREVRSEK